MRLDFKNFDADGKAAAAVSGGADSLALVLLLQEFFPGEIIALTVDHGLRKESAAEARQVGTWLAARGIKHETLVWKGEKPTANIEAIAREKRYGLLCDYCRKNGIKDLFIAHNLTDQAETFLLRLRRSAGLFGLAGMDEESRYAGIRILRPLLNIFRSDLEKYLQSKKQPWIHDPSNDDERYERVKIRNFLPKLAEIGITPATVAASMKHLRADRRIMKKKVDEILADYVKINPKGFLEMDAKMFEEDFSIFIYAISELFCRMGLEIPRAEKIETLYKGKGLKTMTLAGLIFCKNKGKLLIGTEYEKIKNIEVQAKAGQAAAFLGFTITPKFDSIIRPLGNTVTKEIKKAGIPALIRRSLPTVIGRNGEIKVPFTAEKEERLDFSISYNPYIY